VDKNSRGLVTGNQPEGPAAAFPPALPSWMCLAPSEKIGLKIFTGWSGTSRGWCNEPGMELFRLWRRLMGLHLVGDVKCAPVDVRFYLPRRDVSKKEIISLLEHRHRKRIAATITFTEKSITSFHENRVV
jgi:hypothetical protein